MAPPENHNLRRALVPMGLALLLVLVVVAAAFRGGKDAPTLAAAGPTPTPTGASEPTAPPSLSRTDGSAGPTRTTEIGDNPRVTARPRVDTNPTSQFGDNPPPLTGSVNATPGPEATPTPGRALEDLPLSGPGTFTYAPAPGTPLGAAPHRPFAVATEDGSGVDPVELATFVEGVLGDRRSWIGDGSSGFVRVAEGEKADFTFVVAAPQTVDRLCLPLQTESRYSCGNNGWIALNLFRWETATEDWPGSLDVYRHYLVNHEVGHYILGPYHENSCAAAGEPAPIMMQQSIDLLGCAPNGWVYPENRP